LIALPRLRLL